MSFGTTVKAGPSFLLFGDFVEAFSCSSTRSTGDLVCGRDGGLSRRNGYSKASSKSLPEDVDDALSVAKRRGSGLLSSARGCTGSR